MKNVQKIDLGLTGYDELFANDEERKVNKLPRIFDIPISEIDDFPDHPFKVKIDEDMDQLVQSIKERGIITPVTLRPKEDGRYEIVSGHRRKKACELAGLDTVKAEVREMSRDEAIILVDKNIVVVLSHTLDTGFQNVLTAHNIKQARFHTGQFNIRRKQINAFIVGDDRVAGRLLIFYDRLHERG